MQDLVFGLSGIHPFRSLRFVVKLYLSLTIDFLVFALDCNVYHTDVVLSITKIFAGRVSILKKGDWQEDGLGVHVISSLHILCCELE